MRRVLVILCLCFVLVQPAFAGSDAVQTTLYFGLSLPKGGSVSEKQWQGFLADTVTPRFPDGLTVIAAVGQWRDPKSRSAGVMSEATRIVVIVHADTPASARAVAEIKARYVRRFHQVSVLQTDQPVHVVD